MAKLAPERLIRVTHVDAPERTGGVGRLPVYASLELIAVFLEPIAEGVETIEQEKFVREMPVDFMQGYRIGRVLAGEQVPRVLN